jgi:hypothetical protein
MLSQRFLLPVRSDLLQPPARSTMKSNSIAFLICSLLLTELTCAQPTAPLQVLWDKTFGGDQADELIVALPTPDGGVLLGGDSFSDYSGDKETWSFGLSDFWLLRLDADGNKLWEQAYGGTNEEWLETIVPMGAGGFLVAGESYSTPGGNKTAPNYQGTAWWFVRLDVAGQILWDRSFGTAGSDHLAALVTLPDDGFLAGGYTVGSGGNKTSRNYGEPDYVVARYDQDGNKLWDATFGGTAADYLQEILPTADGGFLLAGVSYSIADGNKTSPGHRGFYYDYWVVKTDSQGRKEWEGSWGGTWFESLRATVPRGVDGYLLAGWSDSDVDPTKSSPNRGQGPDYWLVGLNGVGLKTWEQTYGGDLDEYLGAVLPLQDGSFLVGGSSSSKGGTGNKSAPLVAEFTIPLRYDVWVVRLDSVGDMLWDRTLNVSGNDSLLGLAPALGAGAWVAGGQRAPQVSIVLGHFGTLSFWLAQFDGAGNRLRDFVVPAATPTFFHTFGRASDGGFFGAGYTIPTGGNYFLGKRLVVSAGLGMWINSYPGSMDYRIVKVGSAPVASRPGPPEVRSMADLQGEPRRDGFLVSLVGEEGAMVVTEWSTNLIDWTPLSTNTLGTAEVRFTDLGATNAAMRFYRARQTE